MNQTEKKEPGKITSGSVSMNSQMDIIRERQEKRRKRLDIIKAKHGFSLRN